MNIQTVDYVFRRALGDELRKAREKCNITQKELAKALGVARTTIVNFEYGYTKIKQSMFKSLCDYLGLSENMTVTIHFQK